MSEIRKRCDPPFNCRCCDKEFSSAAKRNKHESNVKLGLPDLPVGRPRDPTKVGPFMCKCCDRAFTQKANRDKHERTKTVTNVPKLKPGKTPIKESGLKCAKCGTVLATSSSYVRHMRDMHDEKNNTKITPPIFVIRTPTFTPLAVEENTASV